MRTKYFFPHPNLNDLSYCAFSVVGDIVVISGGVDYLDEDAIKDYKRTLLIKLPSE